MKNLKLPTLLILSIAISGTFGWYVKSYQTCQADLSVFNRNIELMKEDD